MQRWIISFLLIGLACPFVLGELESTTKTRLRGGGHHGRSDLSSAEKGEPRRRLEDDGTPCTKQQRERKQCKPGGGGGASTTGGNNDELTEEEIDRVVTNSLVNDNANGMFEPDRPVNRDHLPPVQQFAPRQRPKIWDERDKVTWTKFKQGTKNIANQKYQAARHPQQTYRQNQLYKQRQKEEQHKKKLLKQQTRARSGFQPKDTRSFRQKRKDAQRKRAKQDRNVDMKFHREYKNVGGKKWIPKTSKELADWDAAVAADPEHFDRNYKLQKNTISRNKYVKRTQDEINQYNTEHGPPPPPKTLQQVKKDLDQKEDMIQDNVIGGSLQKQLEPAKVRDKVQTMLDKANLKAQLANEVYKWKRVMKTEEENKLWKEAQEKGIKDMSGMGFTEIGKVENKNGIIGNLFSGGGDSGGGNGINFGGGDGGDTGGSSFDF